MKGNADSRKIKLDWKAPEVFVALKPGSHPV